MPMPKRLNASRYSPDEKIKVEEAMALFTDEHPAIKRARKKANRILTLANQLTDDE